MREYDHRKIEKKWQQEWARKKLYRAADKIKGKENYYLLTEFPYPSGNLHVGHWYAFAEPDILARYMRMKGNNVMYPIGFDAFGLPAENAAIKNKLNPRKWTEGNIAYMKKQLASMGASFDWSREVQTIDPQYYKWTQWLFLQFYKNGLAYKKETAVNWCPKDKTVLANEQVVNGKCERCSTEVVQKQMLQWNLKITDYADRLADDLTALDWPQQIKESQRNWIGRSEGAEIDFSLVGLPDDSRFVLLHGKGGSPDRNFFPWLMTELQKRGHEVEAPQMPGGDAPDDEIQADFVQKKCTFDERTVIIGHSFGGIVALRLLERGIKVRRVVLAATPYSGIYADKKPRPTVTAALKKGFDFAKIKRNAKVFQVLSDKTDYAVPVADAASYADQLSVKHFEGCGMNPHFTDEKEPDILMYAIPTIRVFTTRPDTLFGATYLVLSPEHPWVTLALRHKTVLKNNNEVAEYVKKASKKTELERQENKEKTGVKLEGVEAINPATGEKIPVFIADYVLAHYGTGAIMAVPAHDERDFEFAKKFDLPIKQVVKPVFSPENRRDDAVQRDTVSAIVRNKEGKILMLKWKKHPWITPVLGGTDGDEPGKAAMREVLEETGYKTRVLQVSHIGVESHFFADHKNEWRNRTDWAVLLELTDETPIPISHEEAARHEIMWMTSAEAAQACTHTTGKLAFDLIFTSQAYTSSRYDETQELTNSGPYAGLSPEEAKRKITEQFGIKKTTYKMRDWVVSRQRYWGVPIPIIHCDKCGDVAVPDKDLPVRLPDVKDYLPTGDGKSPLAKVKKFLQAKCPQCRGKAERETDTFDTFVDSSWYFQRYTDPKNKKKFADAKKMAAWMPIDLYSGGAEHTTMHLLYSRFWHKAMYDLGLVKDSEPYTRRMNRSIILGPDGQKMSKSRGNVIDPDAVVQKLGADTVRMYLAFIGPYNEVASYPWNPDGVVGVRRFLERVWRLHEKLVSKPNADFDRALHIALKKVTEDIPLLKFNTAIAAMMTLLNEAEGKGVTKAQYLVLLHMLAPFAPHMTEELWRSLGNKKSLHLEKWSKYDEKKTRQSTVTIVIQVNGKVRAQVDASADAAEKDIRQLAEKAADKWLTGQAYKKVIYVPNRLINFVI